MKDLKFLIETIENHNISENNWRCSILEFSFIRVIPARWRILDTALFERFESVNVIKIKKKNNRTSTLLRHLKLSFFKKSNGKISRRSFFIELIKSNNYFGEERLTTTTTSTTPFSPSTRRTGDPPTNPHYSKFSAAAAVNCETKIIFLSANQVST